MENDRMKLYRLKSKIRRAMIFGSELYVSISKAFRHILECLQTVNVSEWTIRSAVECGDLPRYKYGRQYLVYLPEVESFVKNKCKERSKNMTKTDIDIFDSFQWYHETRGGIEGIEQEKRLIDSAEQPPRMKKEMVPFVIEQYTGLDYRKVRMIVKRYVKMGYLKEKENSDYYYFDIGLIRNDIYGLGD